MSYPFSPDWRQEFADRCRRFPRQPSPERELKRAAVALVIVDAEDGTEQAAVLLTRRAATLRGHAGQWALPGGRCDPGEIPVDAALRELQEELGLVLGPADVLGVLDDYETRSGYVITPVVAWRSGTAALQPNPAEVASVHRIKLAGLDRPGAIEFLAIPESPRPVIRLDIGDRHIHAPTAALIYQLHELAAGRVTRVAELEQPVFAWR